MSHETTRREFLGTLAAFSLFPLESERPDLILHNANIFSSPSMTYSLMLKLWPLPMAAFSPWAVIPMS
jgi:hypothetical protein